MIIFEPDSEQLALQFVITLVEQICRVVVRRWLGSVAMGMRHDGLGLIVCILYHYYFIEEAKGKMVVIV